MKRILFIIIIAALISVGNTTAQEISVSKPIKNLKTLTGLEKSPNNVFYPAQPGATLWVDTIGTTYYAFQSNGSSGDRIICHDDGSVHICWTNLSDWPYPGSPRNIYCAYRDTLGNWSDPIQVSQNATAGYCQMSEIHGNRATIAYHETSGSDPTYVTLTVEWNPPGLGFFEYHDPPDEVFPQNTASPGRLYWPYITVDRNGYIHEVASENTDKRLMRMAYTRSEDDGVTWTDLELVDTVMVISSVLDASPVSDKVVLAYCDPNDTTTQWNNDIVYYVSEDGQSWNWRYGKINVTNYTSDDDSLWAYTDCDVIIDYNDNVHLVWNASRIDSDNYVAYRTYLFHYCDDSGEITEITHHPELGFDDICGDWSRPICKMSLGCSEQNSGYIAVAWTQFDTADVSVNGFGNGDIWFAASFDSGENWPWVMNITNTSSPGCFSGDCMSEHWSSLSDEVLVEGNNPGYQLTYILDKDAGAAINDEGSATENPVVYDSDIISDIPEEDILPEEVSLAQNYPNPFNVSTTISFTLEKTSQTVIEVFNITGAKVAKLLDKKLDGGRHSITWDASDIASGVYFYQIKTEEYSETRRATLIK